jgi:hypothetical protein
LSSKEEPMTLPPDDVSVKPIPIPRSRMVWDEDMHAERVRVIDVSPAEPGMDDDPNEWQEAEMFEIARRCHSVPVRVEKPPTRMVHSYSAPMPFHEKTAAQFDQKVARSSIKRPIDTPAPPPKKKLLEPIEMSALRISVSDPKPDPVPLPRPAKRKSDDLSDLPPAAIVPASKRAFGGPIEMATIKPPME